MRRLYFISLFLAILGSANAVAINPSAEAIREIRAEQRAEKDLAAQQDMALWAWWMLAITVLSTGVGATGLIFLWLSLRQTRHAIKIAAETNDHAERRMRLEIRPWLEVREVNIEHLHVSTNPENQHEQTLFLRGTYVVRNTGSLPALFVKPIERLILDLDASIRGQLDTMHNASPAGLTHVPAHSEWIQKIVLVQPYDKEKVQLSGSVYLRLEVGLRYGDRHHLSEFTTVAHTSLHDKNDDYITPMLVVKNLDVKSVSIMHRVLE